MFPVGGASGSGKVRGHGWLLLYFFLLKMCSLVQFVLSVHTDSVGSSWVGRLSPHKLKKKKKKDREKEEWKNGVRCAVPSSDHGPVSEGRSSTLRLNWGPLPSPSPQLGRSWKTQRHSSDWERRERDSEKRERGFVCILWPTLATTNTVFALTPHIQQENKWCSNASEAPSNQKHIGLKHEGVGGWKCLWSYMQSRRPSGAHEEGGCAVSASLETSPPHHWSAGRPRQPAARSGPPDTPNVIPQSKAEQRGATESVDSTYFPFPNAILFSANFLTGNRF